MRLTLATFRGKRVQPFEAHAIEQLGASRLAVSPSLRLGILCASPGDTRRRRLGTAASTAAAPPAWSRSGWLTTRVSSLATPWHADTERPP